MASTMIYTHVLRQGTGTRSPLDSLQYRRGVRGTRRPPLPLGGEGVEGKKGKNLLSLPGRMRNKQCKAAGLAVPAARL